MFMVAATVAVYDPPISTQASQEIGMVRSLERLASRTQLVPVFDGSLSTWVLLNRSSYISGLQSSGVIFSRESALELERRALALSEFVGPGNFLSWSSAGPHLSLSTTALQGICSLGRFGYLVTSADLGMQPVAVIDQLKLYACTPQARAAAAAT